MSKNKGLDFSDWAHGKLHQEEEIKKLLGEEANLLGRLEQIEKRLKIVREQKSGLEYSIASGDDVMALAQKKFEEFQLAEAEKEIESSIGEKEEK